MSYMRAAYFAAKALCLKAIAQILCEGCFPPPSFQIVETIHVDLVITGPNTDTRGHFK